MADQTIKEMEAKLVIPPNEEGQVFAASGHDLTQVRMMMEKSPKERILYIQALARSVMRLQRGIRRPT